MGLLLWEQILHIGRDEITLFHVLLDYTKYKYETHRVDLNLLDSTLFSLPAKESI